MPNYGKAAVTARNIAVELAAGALALGLSACPAPERPPAGAGPAPVLPPVGVPPAVAPATARPARPAEQRLGRSAYYLSLPPNYRLKSTDEPNFVVFYFAPADTTVQTKFTGGLYFSGHPQPLAGGAAGCQTRRQPATLLGRPAQWTVRRCATGYTVGALVDSPVPLGRSEKIYFFGEAKSAAELRQLLAILATLRRLPAGPAAPGAAR